MEEALAKGESILTPEEIDSALDTILDYSGIQRCHTPGSDSSSEVADQEEVNAQIQAAEAQLRDVQCGSAIIVSEEFGHMVNTLVSRRLLLCGQRHRGGWASAGQLNASSAVCCSCRTRKCRRSASRSCATIRTSRPSSRRPARAPRG